MATNVTHEQKKCKMCNKEFNPAESGYDSYCNTWCSKYDVPILYIGYAAELCRLIKKYPDVPRYELLEAMYAEFLEPTHILDYTDQEIIDGMAMELSNIWSDTHAENWKMHLPSIRDYAKEYKSISQSLFLKYVRIVIDHSRYFVCSCESGREDGNCYNFDCGCDDISPVTHVCWSDDYWYDDHECDLENIKSEPDSKKSQFDFFDKRFPESDCVCL
jgi:hypothetical protein